MHYFVFFIMFGFFWMFWFIFLFTKTFTFQLLLICFWKYNTSFGTFRVIFACLFCFVLLWFSYKSVLFKLCFLFQTCSKSIVFITVLICFVLCFYLYLWCLFHCFALFYCNILNIFLFWNFFLFKDCSKSIVFITVLICFVFFEKNIVCACFFVLLCFIGFPENQKNMNNQKTQKHKQTTKK